MNKYFTELLTLKTLLNNNYSDEESLKKAIKPTILKLNNPTYYSKYLYAHPSEKYGYASSDYKNNVFVKFTNECIKIMNECQDFFELEKKLQVEISWVYTNNISYWAK